MVPGVPGLRGGGCVAWAPAGTGVEPSVGGWAVTLIWLKRLWRCEHAECDVKTWNERSEAIRPRSSFEIDLLRRRSDVDRATAR